MGGPSKTLCLIFLCVCTFVEFFSKSAPETVQTSQPLHTWPWQGTSWEQPACREPEGRPWKPGVPLTTRLAVARQGTEAGGVRGGRGPQHRLPARPVACEARASRPRCRARAPGGAEAARSPRESEPRPGNVRQRRQHGLTWPARPAAPPPPPTGRCLLHLRARLAGPAACSWGGGVGDTPRRRAQVKTGGTVYT